MNQSYMRFRDFVWRTNPTEISFSTENNVREIQLLYGGCVLQNLGRQPKVISGRGYFSGENAMSDFSALESLFEDGASGMLLISGMAPCRAVFRRLKMLGCPADNVINYEFTFVEDITEYESGGEEKYIILAEGQNLWHISAFYSVPIEDIMALNPDIPSPWEVSAGDRVVIG